ncbi:MAG: DNA translocase FtsK 4TM domain-containing protein [Planctomycetes bacterium]|nr:DNA translocase FtsK 4TM domain-containing protein [Planctomycetota bacterium]
MAAGVWVFLFLAMTTFSASDWPSHVVAIHSNPASNLMGRLGATLAYWIYMGVGFGAWLPMIAFAIGLGAIASGRRVTHPLVRTFGACLMMLAFSAIHALWFPRLGSLTGCEAGLVPQWIAEELRLRFSATATSLALLTALALGAVVCMDEIVFALPRHFSHFWNWSAPMRDVDWKSFMAKLRTRPAVLNLALATAKAGAVAKSGASSNSAVLEADEKEEEKDSDEASDDDDEDEDAEEIDEITEEDEDSDEDDEDEEDEESDEEESEETAEDREDAAAEPIPAPRTLTEEELKAKIAKLPLRMAGNNTVVARDEDIPRQENYDGYQFPGLDLLEDPVGNWSETMETYVRDQAQVLEQALHTFLIDGEVTGIESGPVVTLYSVELAPGTRVARLQTIAADIARSLQAPNIRIIPNMVGRTSIGIEVPNKQKEKVLLKELMSGGHAQGMMLPTFLGKDSSGEPMVIDLAKMPHMLIAGTTGSGKSVCMNTIIMGWLYTKRPDELKLCLIDPKMVEMSQFAEIPHLMCPVVTEMTKAAGILEWAVDKMEERYELLKSVGCRDVTSYNALGEAELFERLKPANDLEKARIPKKLPAMVFVVDELADLIMSHKEVEQSIVRIAQKARAVSIHLVLATQRPQANVVTGLIKSNMPCRISFKVASGMDSRIVLDQKGAELLLGQGDMMVLTPSSSELRRAQGTLVTESETRKVARFLKDVARPSFERSLVAIRGTKAAVEHDNRDGGCAASDGGDRDPMFEKAVEIVIESNRGSVSLLQRRMAIGYGRASRLIDQMGQAGILSDHKGSVAREVLITLDDWHRMCEMEVAAPGTDTDPDNLGATASDDVDPSVPAEFEGEYKN